MGKQRKGPGERKRKATAKMTTRMHETPQGQSGPSGDEPLRLQERIEKRAYELWLTGGCCHGNDPGTGSRPSERCWNTGQKRPRLREPMKDQSPGASKRAPTGKPRRSSIDEARCHVIRKGVVRLALAGRWR